MNKKKLLELLNKAVEDAKKFVIDNTKEDGTMEAGHKEAYDKQLEKIKNIKEQIKNLEEIEGIDNFLNMPTAPEIKSEIKDRKENDKEKKDKEYENAFLNYIKKGKTQEVVNVLKEGTGENGGYLVPTEFEKTLKLILEEENVIRSVVTILKVGSHERKIPVVAGEGTAQWIDENGQYNESDDTFAQISLGAFKCGTLMKVSEELLADSMFNIESYLKQGFAKRIAKAEEKAFIVGDGTNCPTGIFTESKGASEGATTAGATLASDDLLELIHSLKPVYRKNARFLLNDKTLKEIRKLKDSQGNYIWQPGLTSKEPATILGYPYLVSEFVPDATTKKTFMAFGDFSYYYIADRQGITMRKLGELYAANGQVGFRAEERTDGKLTNKEAIKLLKLK